MKKELKYLDSIKVLTPDMILNLENDINFDQVNIRSLDLQNDLQIKKI